MTQPMSHQLPAFPPGDPASGRGARLTPDIRAELAHVENGDLADSLAWLELSPGAQSLRIREWMRETRQDVKKLGEKLDFHIAQPRMRWTERAMLAIMVIAGGVVGEGVVRGEVSRQLIEQLFR